MDQFFAQLEATRTQLSRSLIHNKVFIASEILIAATLLILGCLLPAKLRSIIPLLIYAGLSIRIRRVGVYEIGLHRPSSWRSVALTGLIIGVSLAFVGNLVILPLLQRWTGIKSFTPGELPEIPGNYGLLIIILGLNWLLAAGGEEFLFRGYLLNRILDLAGDSSFGTGIGVLLSAALFSLAHGFSNIWFVASTMFVGLLYGIVYIAYGRNLWPTIIAHGVSNTLGIAMAFSGLIG